MTREVTRHRQQSRAETERGKSSATAEGSEAEERTTHHTGAHAPLRHSAPHRTVTWSIELGEQHASNSIDAASCLRSAIAAALSAQIPPRRSHVFVMDTVSSTAAMTTTTRRKVAQRKRTLSLWSC